MTCTDFNRARFYEITLCLVYFALLDLTYEHSVAQSYFFRHRKTAMQQQLSVSNILLICNVMIHLASSINISSILSAMLLSVHTLLNRIFLTHYVLYFDLYLSQLNVTLDNRRTSKYRHFDKWIKAFVNVRKTNNFSF